LPICSWLSKSFEIIFTFKSSMMEMPRRKENKAKRNACWEGVRKVETTPLLDYRTSVAAWALFEFSTTTLRAYCLVSTGLTLGPHPWATPTSESIYLRTFKTPSPCTQRLRKLAGNWFYRHRSMLPHLEKNGKSRITFEVIEWGDELNYF